jgi:hypothetical protein
MWVAMSTQSSKLPRFTEHRLRNALTVAAIVLAPSVALIVLGLTRPAS